MGVTQIQNCSSEKILDMIIDATLSLEKHIKQIFAKDRAKLKALARTLPFMKTQKKYYQ